MREPVGAERSRPRGPTAHGGRSQAARTPPIPQADARATNGPRMPPGKDVPAPTSSGHRAAATSHPTGGSVRPSPGTQNVAGACAGEGEPQPGQAPARRKRRAPVPAAPRRAEPGSAQPPKASRRTPDEQTRLYLNVGTEMGVSEADIVGTILGETGLPRKVVGAVDIRERHLFVDVASEHANSIISKLNRAQIKGRKAKVKVA